MDELIQQVAAMSSNQNADSAGTSQPRNPKRKADETDAVARTGSGNNGKYLPLKWTSRETGKEKWTKATMFGFPKGTEDSPVIFSEISWDGSWPDDKKAYYNARKKVEAAEKVAKQDKAARTAAGKANRIVGSKKEATNLC